MDTHFILYIGCTRLTDLSRYVQNKARDSGLKICGILVANATMFSHLLPGLSCGSKHLLLP